MLPSGTITFPSASTALVIVHAAKRVATAIQMLLSARY
jgi:hypothetical protein